MDLESYFADLLGAGIPIFHRDLDTAPEAPRPMSAPSHPATSPPQGVPPIRRGRVRYHRAGAVLRERERGVGSRRSRSPTPGAKDP
jgi:hypothetical protein